jgi:hypothetical protein
MRLSYYLHQSLSTGLYRPALSLLWGLLPGCSLWSSDCDFDLIHMIKPKAIAIITKTTIISELILSLLSARSGAGQCGYTYACGCEAIVRSF